MSLKLELEVEVEVELELTLEERIRTWNERNLLAGVLTFPDTEKEVKNVQTIHVSRKAKNKDFGSPGSTPQGSIQKGEVTLSKLSTGDLISRHCTIVLNISWFSDF